MNALQTLAEAVSNSLPALEESLTFTLGGYEFHYGEDLHISIGSTRATIWTLSDETLIEILEVIPQVTSTIQEAFNEERKIYQDAVTGWTDVLMSLRGIAPEDTASREELIASLDL